MSKRWDIQQDEWLHEYFDVVGGANCDRDSSRPKGSSARRVKALKANGAWDAITRLKQAENDYYRLAQGWPEGPHNAADLDASGWMPIETAPKDGTEIVLAWKAVTHFAKPPEWHQGVGRWDEEFQGVWELGKYIYRGAWTDYTVDCWIRETYAELHPTHWHPLSKPPVSEPAQ